MRAELKKIIAFWCDMGADGFRVDMAQSLVKSDNKNRDGVRRLWNEIFEWYNAAYPENIMLSEWSNPEQSLSAGFNIDLLIHNGIGGKVYRPLVCETTDKMVPTNNNVREPDTTVEDIALHGCDHIGDDDACKGTAV